MADIIKSRRDTAANWRTANPTLAEGELGFETDTKRYKLGDGKKAWNSLEYRDYDIDDEPTAGSENLVKSGGVFKVLKKARVLELGNIKNVLLENIDLRNISNNNVILSWNEDGQSATIKGIPTGYPNLNLINGNPSFIIKGHTYYVVFESDDEDVVFQVYIYTGEKNEIKTFSSDGELFIPSDCTNIIARVRGNNNSEEYNAHITIGLLDDVPVKQVQHKLSDINDEIERVESKLNKRIYGKEIPKEFIQDNTVDLNNILEDGYYTISDSADVINGPDIKITGLTVEKYGTITGAFVKQTVENLLAHTTTKVFSRVSNSRGVFSEWKEIDVVKEIFNRYENIYNVTAEPTITTDTNNFLASKGTKDDVTSEIATMLTETGVCRLGPGKFYVRDLQMPNNTIIVGSGFATEIVLLGYDSTDGYAIKLGSNCIVKDLCISGYTASVSLDSSILDRHGILWEGDATENGTSNSNIPVRSTVENVYFRYFKGGAITLRDTGYGVSNCLNVQNCFIWGCRCGINISYWSEFHRFTNIHINGCYYGVINNGGNNVFSSCCFSGNTLAFLIDNTENKSLNNAHGSAVGCVFNHSGANSGVGIKIINSSNGFIFSGCQCFYSKIELIDTKGIVFNAFDCGNNEGISVQGGGLIIFSNCLYGSKPTIVVSNNEFVKFKDCYVRSTGEEVNYI